MTIRLFQASGILLLGIATAAGADEAVPPVFAEAEAVRDLSFDVAQKLIKLMNDKTVEEEYRHRAIHELAALRLESARGPLLNNLLFTGPLVSGTGPLSCYPAAQALFGYGNSIYPDLQGLLSDECSKEYLYVLACLLHTIDGKQVALLRVEKEFAHEPLTERQRRNFTLLIDRLKTTNFDDPLNWPRLNLKRRLSAEE